MKLSLLKATALGCVGAFLATAPAFAGNSTVEDALKRREDLSTFYQGLISTGVINELQEGRSYTVFAPTNEAFAKMSVEKYPCFYSVSCKAEVAQIMRNHIVPGEIHVRDVSTKQAGAGGVMSLFSINDDHLIVSEPFKNDYTVDGHHVVSENQLMGSVLYKMDGVLVSERDLVEFMAPTVYQTSALPPRVPSGEVVTITSPVVVPQH